MTIETLTDLIHENMYDRLNDEREITHEQEMPQKRIWSKKASYDRKKEDCSTTEKNIKITVG